MDKNETTVAIFQDKKKWWWHRYNSYGKIIEGPIGPFNTRNKVMEDLQYEYDTIIEPED